MTEASACETVAPVGDARAVGRSIVLFADGTGNAFAKQESNVWRLYGALDTAIPTQIAMYLPGVGTSGFRPWAIIDAATGLGVPGNVRRLYEFLCWNYRPGDRIYMFGFSRGAFTVRSLVGLIDSEGLIRTQGKHGTASRPEMRRNVMAAWRAYRSKRRRGFLNEAPTIKVMRFVRDLVLRVWHAVLLHEPYDTVRSRSDITAGIRFLGLFDTVEAYGVPIEEMRDAIDWAIWPIRFRNRKLSTKVERASHALSLDDERQTFHPVRFDQSDAGSDRIREVWFAGVHSDVGGGYPDDANALVVLNWMLDEAPSELRFKRSSLGTFRSSATSLDATHDSRSGMAVFYRYDPRWIGSGRADGGAPVIHHSVIEKMVFGPSRYAPLTLPEEVRVLMPDGSRPNIAGFEARRLKGPSATTDPTQPGTLAASALAQMKRPDTAFVRAVRTDVWLRRKAYFLLLSATLAFVSLPWTAKPIAELLATLVPWSAGWVDASNGERLIGVDGSDPNAAVGFVEQSGGALNAWVQDLAPAVRQFTPSYARLWTDVVVAQPVIAFGVLAVILALYLVNGVLRDMVNDDARCAWFETGTKVGPRSWRNHLFGWIDHVLRWADLRSLIPAPFSRGPFYAVGFTLSLAAFATGFLLYIDRVCLSYRIGSGSVCRLDNTQTARRITPGQPETSKGFSPSNPCWDSGLFLDGGNAYELTLRMTTPFMDGPVLTDIQGFAGGSWAHRLGAPLKRWFSADYFQPIARVGARGMQEWVLASSSGEEHRDLGGAALVTATAGGTCSAATPDPAEVDRISHEQSIRHTLTTRFVAPQSGELFLYVNDAMLGLDPFPQTAPADCFYRNNIGRAEIEVTLLGTSE